MKTKDLLGIFLFCVVIRAACTLLIVSRYPDDEYFLNLIFQAAAEILSILLCKLLMKIDFSEMETIFGGGIGIHKILVALTSGVILVMFTMGENAVEALIVAQYNPQRVFEIWNFRTTAQEVYPLFSLRVLGFLAVACLVAPICEELFFRGFLLRSLLQKKRLPAALIVNCSIFTALHFSHEYYISTFVFSLFLCCAYLITRSVLFCILVHSAYNFFAFLQNYSFNEYFIRSIDNISSPTSWVLEIFSLVFSILFILYLFFRFGKNFDWLNCRSHTVRRG